MIQICISIDHLSLPADFYNCSIFFLANQMRSFSSQIDIWFLSNWWLLSREVSLLFKFSSFLWKALLQLFDRQECEKYSSKYPIQYFISSSQLQNSFSYSSSAAAYLILWKKILQIYLNYLTYSLLPLTSSETLFSSSCLISKALFEVDATCDFFFLLLRLPMVDLVYSIFSSRSLICFKHSTFYFYKESIESGSYFEESNPKSLKTNFTFFSR